MRILSILKENGTNEEFLAGLSKLHEIRYEPSTIEEGYIIFCVQGHAEMVVNLNRYNVSPNGMMVLFHGDIVRILHRSEDFMVQMAAIGQDLLKEACINLETVVYEFLHKKCYVEIADPDRAKRFNQVLNNLQYIYEDKNSIVRRELFQLQTRCFFLGVYDVGRRRNKKQLNDVDFSSSRAQQLVKQYLYLVIDRSKEHRDVQYYAEQLCITPKYLNSIVRKITGKNAKCIIDDRVMVMIKIALRTTNMSIQQISDEFKFPNQSFFGRYVNKHIGKSPTEYRNEEKYRIKKNNI